MPNKLQIAALLAAIGSTYSLTRFVYIRKYKQIARVLLAVGSERDTLQTQIGYLVDVLNENDVELSEFDLIALNNAIPLSED